MWFDHVCWSLVNVVLLVAMWAAAVVGPLLARPVRWTSEALHARYERPCTSPSYGTGATHSLSAVNAETPDIHHSYLVDPQDKTGGTDLRRRGFDLDNSLLFIHLCALVYEDECILDYALQQWHLEYEIFLSRTRRETGARPGSSTTLGPPAQRAIAVPDRPTGRTSSWWCSRAPPPSTSSSG